MITAILTLRESQSDREVQITREVRTDRGERLRFEVAQTLRQVSQDMMASVTRVMDFDAPYLDMHALRDEIEERERYKDAGDGDNADGGGSDASPRSETNTEPTR